jgi:hypothetical protein
LIIVTIAVSCILGFNNIISGDLYNVLITLSILPVMLMPRILRKWFKLKIDPAFEMIYIIFIFFAHFLGSVLKLYNLITWYDGVMHLLSGMLVPFAAIVILISFKQYNPKKLWFNIVFIIVFNLAIAALWEFNEFIFDNLFNKDAQRVIATGVNDTMKDMIAAFLGSILFCIMYFYEEVTKNKIIVKHFIEELRSNER